MLLPLNKVAKSHIAPARGHESHTLLRLQEGGSHEATALTEMPTPPCQGTWLPLTRWPGGDTIHHPGNMPVQEGKSPSKAEAPSHPVGISMAPDHLWDRHKPDHEHPEDGDTGK